MLGKGAARRSVFSCEPGWRKAIASRATAQEDCLFGKIPGTDLICPAEGMATAADALALAYYLG